MIIYDNRLTLLNSDRPFKGASKSSVVCREGNNINLNMCSV